MIKISVDVENIIKNNNKVREFFPFFLINAMATAMTPVLKETKKMTPVQSGTLKKSLGKLRSLDKISSRARTQIIVRPGFLKPPGRYTSPDGRIFFQKKAVETIKYGPALFKRQKLDEQIMTNTKDKFISDVNNNLQKNINNFVLGLSKKRQRRK